MMFQTLTREEFYKVFKHTITHNCGICDGCKSNGFCYQNPFDVGTYTHIGSEQELELEFKQTGDDEICFRLSTRSGESLEDEALCRQAKEILDGFFKAVNDYKEDSSKDNYNTLLYHFLLAKPYLAHFCSWEKIDLPSVFDLYPKGSLNVPLSLTKNIYSIRLYIGSLLNAEFSNELQDNDDIRSQMKHTSKSALLRNVKLDPAVFDPIDELIPGIDKAHFTGITPSTVGNFTLVNELLIDGKVYDKVDYIGRVIDALPKMEIYLNSKNNMSKPLLITLVG